MKLSIIVPVYNMAAEGKLEYCIRSLLNQQLEDYEIIAVDDASTDDSPAILKRLEQENPGRLRVILSGENHHQGGARNLGIKASESEFIGFMDADDWAAPDMYAKLLARAEKTGADVVGCDYNLVYEHTMEIGRWIPENTPDQTGVLDEEKRRRLVLNPGSMVVKIYRREVIAGNDLWFPEDIFYEDNCMSCLWLLYCSRFERVDEPLYYYYQHGSSTVHHISEQKCRDRVTAMELLIEKSKSRGLYERFESELVFKYTQLAFAVTLFSCMQGRMRGKYRYVGELKKNIKSKFPDFAGNKYYREQMDAEEQKLILLLMRSRLLFWIYYHALRTYRKVRYKSA